MKKAKKQVPWANAFKAVQKLLAFVCCAKESDLMNGKGKTNGSIKKIIRGQTGGETVSEHKASGLLPRNAAFWGTTRPCRRDY